MIRFKDLMLILEGVGEDKIRQMKKMFKDKLKTSDSLPTTDHVVDHFAESDPHPKKQNLQWILNQYKKGNVNPEDRPDITTTLNNFTEHGKHLEKKDLNAYKHIDHLKQAMTPYTGENEVDYKAKAPHPDAPLIHKHGQHEVRELNSKEASIHYFHNPSGKNECCTAYTDDTNMHDDYSQDGQLYRVIARNGEGKMKDYNMFISNDTSERYHELADRRNDHSDFEDKNGDSSFYELIKHNPELKNVDAWQGKYPALTNDENFDKYFDKFNPIDLLGDPRLKKHHIDKLAKKYLNNEKFHRAIVNNSNASDDTLSMIGDKSDEIYVHKAIANHQNASEATKEKSNDFLSLRYRLTPQEKIDEIAKKYLNHENFHNEISNHQNASDDTLRMIGKKSDKNNVHVKISNHQNASDDTLRMLGEKSDDFYVHRAIANHPKASDDTLRMLGKKSNSLSILQLIADHSNASDDTLRMLGDKSDNVGVHEAIANHPNASNYTLRMIGGKSKYDSIHEAIAKHKNASDDTLRMLGDKSNNSNVHSAILNHPNVSSDTLNMIGDRSNVPFVHRAIVKHQNASEATKEKSNDFLSLRDDDLSQEQVNKLAKKYLNNENFHEAIAMHPNASDNTLHMIGDKANDWQVHQAIASHQNASDNTLHMIGDKANDFFIHQAIASHQNASDDTLNMIGDKSKDSNVHRVIANRSHASDDTLHLLAKKSNNTDVHHAIAKKQNASGDTLRKLAEKSDNWDVYRAIVNHPNASDDTLRMFGKKSYHNDVHQAIVRHQNASNATKEYSNDFLSLNDEGTSQEKVNKIAKKYLNNKDFHYIIGKHPNVSSDTLRMLADKSNEIDAHQVIANHPNASDDTLRMIGDKSNNSNVHSAILNHLNVSDATKELIKSKMR